MTRSRSGRSALAAAVLALLVGACAPTPGTIAPDASPSQPGAKATPAPTPLPISVTEVKYGLLSIRTAPAASCQASLRITRGYFGDAPPETLPGQSANANGLVTWTYAAPRVPSGTAGYTVNCSNDTASEAKTGNFTIATHPLFPTALRVRVTTETPLREPFNPIPSLFRLRDESFAKITATLATEWKSATRGLGSIEVDDASADITIFVVAAHGTSVHRTWPDDDSQDIVIYVEDDRGRQRAVENTVAVALHELGHIWCCRGPNATTGGHWASKDPSPGLYGVDKFGIMNEPVDCTFFGPILSCPNRFSDREMVALGFTNFPAPAPDPCIIQSLSVRSQVNTIEAQLVSLRSQINAIERQYPGGIPAAIYDSYIAMVSQYNALVGRQNALVGQLNALPCDSS